MNFEIFLKAVTPVLECLLMYAAFLVGSFSSIKFIKEEDSYYNNRKKYLILSAIVFALVSCINISKYIKLLVGCIINGVLVYHIVGEKIERSIGFNSYVLIIDSVLVFTLSLIKGLDYVVIRFIVLVVFYLLDKCIYKFFINKNTVKDFEKIDYIKFIINYIVIIGCVSLCIYSLYNKSITYISNLIFMGLLVIYINFNVFKNFNINKKLVYIQTLESDRERLSTENDRIRIFKHDFNNIIQAMNGYIQTEDIPSLKKYVKKMIKDVNETDDSKIGNEFLLNNKAITNLLKSKNVKAKKENIDIKFEIMFELKLLKKYEYELIRVLGIFLDNAIEAQREEDDKVIEVLFFKDANCKRIIIENTCTKNIDIDKIYTKEFSTKKGNTGLGLWEVKNFVDNNPNFSLETTLENNCFKHTLYIL